MQEKLENNFSFEDFSMIFANIYQKYFHHIVVIVVLL